MGAAVNVLLDALSMSLPVDGVENCLRPLIALSDVFSEWFCRRLMPDGRFVMACYRACGELEICAGPSIEAYHWPVLAMITLVLVSECVGVDVELGR